SRIGSDNARTLCSCPQACAFAECRALFAENATPGIAENPPSLVGCNYKGTQGGILRPDRAFQSAQSRLLLASSRQSGSSTATSSRQHQAYLCRVRTRSPDT